MLLFSMGVIDIKTTPNILCTTVYLPWITKKSNFVQNTLIYYD
jgi:hypothetical protein